jgi:hypothetical protein
MTTHDEIEARLSRAFELTPSPDAMSWIDQRVRRAMDQGTTQPRRGLSRRSLLRPLPLVAALILAAGTVAAGLTALERLAATTPGWQTAWDRAEVIGVDQTSEGYTLTLERAYADVNQVVVFVSVTGLPGLDAPRATDGSRSDHLYLAGVDLRDPRGRHGIASMGSSDLDPGLAAAAEAVQFETPPTAGTYVLTVSSIRFGGDGPDCVSPCVADEIPGTWRFEFALPEPAGTIASVEATDTHDGVTVTLTELRISPTMITSTIALRVDGADVMYWGYTADPITLRSGGTTHTVTSGTPITRDPLHQGPAGGVIAFSTPSGADTATGTWEITIPEILLMKRGSDSELPVGVTGPWKLIVELP